MENIEYTSNEDLINQLEKNNGINAIGYVVDVSIHSVGVKQKHTLLKFNLSNGHSKIACRIWGELVNHYSHAILPNRIVRIDYGKIKRLDPYSSFPINIESYDYPFELIVVHGTVLTFYGIHQ